MSEYIKVAVDAMGGDNAPLEIVKGAVDAIKKNKKVKGIITGNMMYYREILLVRNYWKQRKKRE